MVLGAGVVIGILFLEETHEGKKDHRDAGIEIGRWLLRHLRSRPEPVCISKISEASIEAHQTLLEDEAPPGYRTTEGSPRQPSSCSQSPRAGPADSKWNRGRRSMSNPRGVRNAFTKQVILNIIGFGILA